MTDHLKNILWPETTVKTDIPILSFEDDLTTCLEEAMDFNLYFEEDGKKSHIATTEEDDYLDLLNPETSFDLSQLIEGSPHRLFSEVLLPETSPGLSAADELAAAIPTQMPVFQVTFPRRFSFDLSTKFSIWCTCKTMIRHNTVTVTPANELQLVRQTTDCLQTHQGAICRISSNSQGSLHDVVQS